MIVCMDNNSMIKLCECAIARWDGTGDLFQYVWEEFTIKLKRYKKDPDDYLTQFVDYMYSDPLI